MSGPVTIDRGGPVTGVDPKVQAFLLIRDFQSGDTEALARLARLIEETPGPQRPAMTRIGLFGLVIEAWIFQHPSLPQRIDALIQKSEEDGDQAFLAVGLSMRSNLSPESLEPATYSSRDSDLARAVIAVEGCDCGALETVTARTSCGIAFGSRALWELSDHEYEAALTLLDQLDEAGRDAVLAAVVFNRAENQVAWASTLRQVGDLQGVTDLRNSWQPVCEAAERFYLPPAWRMELDALGLLIRSIAGEDVGAELESIPHCGDEAGRKAPLLAHVSLARALSDANAGRPQARVSAERAVECVDPEAFPHMYDLAMFLAAELEGDTGGEAGLRCARNVLSRVGTDRLARLSSMRSRLEAERLIADHRRLAREVTQDHLTGIGNRRALAGYLEELRRQEVSDIALIMTDVDGFKSVNDCHGHHTGDATLVAIAEILVANIRSTDRAVRLGGDEFMVVMAGTGLDVAEERAQAVMERIREQRWGDLSPGLVVTVSIGVAGGALADLDEISVRADSAVYQAKALGGNAIICNK